MAVLPTNVELVIVVVPPVTAIAPPRPSAVFPVNVEPRTVRVPSVRIAPPKYSAPRPELLSKVEAATVTVAPELTRRPAPSAPLAPWLPLIVVAVRVAVAPPPTNTPPPSPAFANVFVLAEIVLLMIVSVPVSTATPPPFRPDVLAVTMSWSSVRLPPVSRAPPPSSAAALRPLVIVSPEIVTVAPVMSNTRKALFPLTVSCVAPGPVMVRSPVMAGSAALVAVMVWPARLGSKVMLSAPAAAFASVMAWRSDPAPVSLVVVTVNVAGTSRPSRAVSVGRNPRRLADMGEAFLGLEGFGVRQK
ncbi:MAG TPA: hypothetical protein VH092_21280 [Urbifossiella sp.]|nr:hypothetical protein [Urbifossiella sp.]